LLVFPANGFNNRVWSYLRSLCQPALLTPGSNCLATWNYPGACTVKHYGFRSRLVCSSKQVKVTDSRKDVNLLRNLIIFCKLCVRHVFIVQTPRACSIKLITAVIYSFRNRLECLSLASLSSLV